MLTIRGLIALSAIGIWIIVLQNFGIIPKNQDVYVLNTVDVRGNVDNHYKRHPDDYYRIPICF